MSAVPGGTHAERDSGADTLIAPICDLLLASLKTRADCGQADAACRLAGRACVLLRQSQPGIAKRFDVFLHRLTPKLTWDIPPPQA